MSGLDLPPIRYARTPDGADLAYRVWPGGPADLVFVQAYTSAFETFAEWPGHRRLVEGFASFARVIEFDHRGSGLSTRTGSPPAIEVRAKDLGVLLDAVGVDRASMFAIGDGAAVAAVFAATSPDRVTSLALFHPAVRTAWAEDWPWGTTDEEAAASDAALDGLWDTPEPSLEQIGMLSGDLGASADDPGFARWFNRAVRHTMSPAEFQAFDHIWMQTDVRDVLPAVHAPTAVLFRADAGNGAPDAIERDRQLIEATARLIPGAELVPLPGVEFLPILGDIDAVVDAVAKHLRVERPPQPTDRVLASVLFTDIVDSTRLAAEMGDARWKELLARHDDIERSMLDRFGGRFIHTTGDGMLATFDGPARAVHCAQQIVEAVRPLGLQIRAGVHTGEVELVAGDVQGLAVHIGARVAALAGPSQVYASRTVKDLVAGSGLTFEDAGEHELKGVPDSWRLYLVTP